MTRTKGTGTSTWTKTRPRNRTRTRSGSRDETFVCVFTVFTTHACIFALIILKKNSVVNYYLINISLKFHIKIRAFIKKILHFF